MSSAGPFKLSEANRVDPDQTAPTQIKVKTVRLYAEISLWC